MKVPSPRTAARRMCAADVPTAFPRSAADWRTGRGADSIRLSPRAADARSAGGAADVPTDFLRSAARSPLGARQGVHSERGKGETRATQVAPNRARRFRSSSLGDKLHPCQSIASRLAIARGICARFPASGGRLALSVDFPPAGRGGRRLGATAAWASPERLNFWYNTRQREQRKVIRYVDPMLQAARQEDRGTQRRRSRCGRRRRRGSFKENEARRKEARRDVRQPKRRGKKRGAADAAPLFLPRSGGWLTSRRAS